MMQETGNNNKNSNTILSIRLITNGLYFTYGNSQGKCIEGKIEDIIQENNLLSENISRVNLSIVSKSAMLIPQEFAQDKLYSEANNGIIEQIDDSEPRIQTLRKLYGEKLHFNSALLDIASKEKGEVVSLALYQDICSVIVTLDGSIIMAQNLPVDNYADILYYISTFITTKKPTISIVFDSTNKLRKQIKPYYKKTIECA